MFLNYLNLFEVYGISILPDFLTVISEVIKIKFQEFLC
jgi:hypothetical protein